jgi:hypothetical protein
MTPEQFEKLMKVQMAILGEVNEIKYELVNARLQREQVQRVREEALENLWGARLGRWLGRIFWKVSHLGKHS